ncbi:hypothetical protein ACFP1Z_11855 [Streptomyces gamaensis]|uniref:Uncharacterized protein n=1 Tax=Streptomyces gamaensis TaxID=1763542 RepID=A0ABW0YWA6_9ACTN
MAGAVNAARGYWCEVVYGGAGWGRIVLGTLPTPFLGRALRWLRRQAVRIADGLDPDPDTAPSPHGALHKVNTEFQLGDAPAELRAWANDDRSRQAAYDQLRGGTPFALTATDHTGRYVLAAWPVDVPARLDALPAQSTNSHSGHLK